jgi:hypothetical protein
MNDFIDKWGMILIPFLLVMVLIAGLIALIIELSDDDEEG